MSLGDKHIMIVLLTNSNLLQILNNKWIVLDKKKCWKKWWCNQSYRSACGNVTNKVKYWFSTCLWSRWGRGRSIWDLINDSCNFSTIFRSVYYVLVRKYNINTVISDLNLPNSEEKDRIVTHNFNQGDNYLYSWGIPKSKHGKHEFLV